MDCVEIRNMNCELGTLSRPDGSALFTAGDTVVLSAVYGPVEVKPQKLLVECATIEVTFKPKAGLSSVTDKIKEAMLLNIYKNVILSSLHPRTSISIIVQEMQDSGGLLACSINSSCLALMNAGIPLKFLVAAISCMIDKQDKIVLDPDLTQLKDSKASFTIVFDSVNKNIIASESSGRFSKQQLEQVFSVCKEASLKIFSFYYDVVKKSTFSTISN